MKSILLNIDPASDSIGKWNSHVGCRPFAISPSDTSIESSSHHLYKHRHRSHRYSWYLRLQHTVHAIHPIDILNEALNSPQNQTELQSIFIMHQTSVLSFVQTFQDAPNKILFNINCEAVRFHLINNLKWQSLVISRRNGLLAFTERMKSYQFGCTLFKRLN